VLGIDSQKTDNPIPSSLDISEMLDRFFDDAPLVTLEIRRRIALSVAAYAYEFSDTPIMSDEEYDEISKLIDPNRETSYGNRDNTDIDKYFSEYYTPYSGQWIHNHPDIEGIKYLYNTHYKGKRKTFSKLL
jgi:hypothetical protein